MKLAELLEKTKYEVRQGSTDQEVKGLAYDSRKVSEGFAFVCISGSMRDGHDFIPEVVKKGAKVLVVQKEVEAPEDVTVIRVKNTRLALALMSAAWFDYPAEKLKTIGITGTKGKTTTSYMIKSILEQGGIKTGLIGTIEVIIGDRRQDAKNTTPESYDIQEFFAKMAEAGLSAVVMEVSSQGLKLDRVAGIQFDYGEHKDFAEYMYCKSLLFKQCKVGLFNVDSEHVSGVLEGHTCSVETFGFGADADLRAEQMELVHEPGKIGVRYHVGGVMDFDADINVPGRFSVYNSLAAIAVCRHFAVTVPEIKKALADVAVKGRIEIVPVSSHYTLMIDYAHNAMALESLLTTLREYEPKRLICLFGCGGNRAKARRYEMGEVSARLADFTVVTSDNPRFEQPIAIINDILVGVKKIGGKYVAIPDRKEAIAYCMANAKEGDVIVLAGKGHEDYQEIKGKKYPMDERELIAEIKREMFDSKPQDTI